MAGENWTTAHALSLFARLAEAPYAFGFFQVLRRLECVFRDRPRLGTSSRAGEEPIRLGQVPTLEFPPSTLAGFEPAADGRPPRLTQHFLGLLGPQGALPLHLTDYAHDRVQHVGDTTLVRFLDVFHHRILTLFYRAWADAEPTVSFDRPEDDRFGVYVGALFGLGLPSLQDRDDMPDLAKLHFAGRLALQTRHPEGLQAILSALFVVPVLVREFVGAWLHLPEQSLCRLGAAREAGTLGVSATVGSRVWASHHKFRILFGPMTFADYERFLPGGPHLKRLVALVRNYVGDELLWDINLVLRRDEVPGVELGRAGRLGWTTWVKSRPFERDADDLVLEPMAYRT